MRRTNTAMPSPSLSSSTSTIASETHTTCIPPPPLLPSLNTTPSRPQSFSITSPPHSSLLSPSIIDSCMAKIDQPVQVILVVYDLLPEGNLSRLAWKFGVGLYHSAIKIPAIGKEITFGGHPHPQISGIFALPIRDDGSPSMPGLRCLCEIDMGQVQTAPQLHSLKLPESSTRSHNTFNEEDESGGLIKPPPSAKLDKHKSDSYQDHAYPPTPMTTTAASPQKLLEGSNHHPYASSTNSSSDSNESSSSLFSSLTQMETLALILDRLTRSPDWHGTSYDLLRRNCNSFSDELCMLLTGKNAPNWLNRAASLGSAFPCLVPSEWVEPPAAPTELDQSVDSEQNYDLQFTRKPSATTPINLQSPTITTIS